MNKKWEPHISCLPETHPPHNKRLGFIKARIDLIKPILGPQGPKTRNQPQGKNSNTLKFMEI